MNAMQELIANFSWQLDIVKQDFPASILFAYMLLCFVSLSAGVSLWPMADIVPSHISCAWAWCSHVEIYSVIDKRDIKNLSFLLPATLPHSK